MISFSFRRFAPEWSPVTKTFRNSLPLLLCMVRTLTPPAGSAESESSSPGSAAMAPLANLAYSTKSRRVSYG